tara:strand:- start:2332 stop:2541 length:210 start_codon:yes stop_codon:yes gene_type:complete
MSKETVTKYLLEIRLVKVEVDRDSEEEGDMDYYVVESEEELLECSDDYDEMRELFNDYVKKLEDEKFTL